MAKKNQQNYHFDFVYEDGKGLERMNEILTNNSIESSIDSIYSLEQVNEALMKVSKGKTIFQIKG